VRKYVAAIVHSAVSGISFHSWLSPTFNLFLETINALPLTKAEFTKFLSLTHRAVESLIMKDLAQARFVNLSADTWSSVTLEKFVSVTAYHLEIST